MKRNFLLCYIFLFVTVVGHAQSYTVSGYISDAKSSETLISSSVFEAKSGKGTVSNAYGFYSLTLPKSEVFLSYSYVGYRGEQRVFKLSKDTVINIQLQEATELKEVVVTANRKELGVKGSQMSAIDIPITQIKTIPALFGETDVLKALQLLPGVKAGTEGSAGFHVRGGGPDENLLLLDGVPVYNVNHLFGFFSVFNADAIKNVTLYKGSFPARFGGRLSSVVDIQMKDGNNKKLHGNFTIGLISSKINLEGPLFSDKTTFNISARRTYADLLAKPFMAMANSKNSTDKTTGGYYFYDLNAKISHRISDRDKLFLSMYMGDDVINVNDKYTYNSGSDNYSNSGSTNTYKRTDIDKVDWKWGNIISALRWNHLINNKLFMNTTAAVTRYRFDMGIGTDYESSTTSPATYSKETTSVRYKSGIVDYSAKVDFDYTPNSNHDIKFGANYTFHTFRPGVLVAKSKTIEDSSTERNDTTVGDKNVSAHETMLYAEDNISINRVFKLNAGLHYSSFIVQKQFYNSLQPRLGARILLNDKLSLKAGYAYMSQYIHLLSNSNISLPTDLWVPVTKRIAPMKSSQYSLGAFYNLLNLFDLSVEGYYKSMDNLIEYKDGASFLGSSTGWEDKVSLGRGWAYGIEFLAQKTVGKTTGWVGYTWSKTERLFDREGEELNNGVAFPAKYDRRHNINIVLSHKFSEKFDIATTWTYSTGSCGTLALQNFAGTTLPGNYQTSSQYSYGYSSSSSQYNVYLPYVGSRNNYRYAPYHRLDIGMNFHKQRKHGIRTWNISVYNAYNQKNPFITMQNDKYSYDPATNTSKTTKKLTQYSIFPIIPSVSYSYKF
jgi:hypothetical protein